MATTVLTSCNNNYLTDATNRPVQQHRSLTVCLEEESVQKAKRCLFGVPDHQAVSADLSVLRRQLDAQSRQRWNFDFRSGTPLTSLPLSTAASGDDVRWIWTRVSESLTRDGHRPHVRTVSAADYQDIGRRTGLTVKASPSSSPRHLLDRPVKRRRMSLTPSVEVKVKVTGSEVKAVSCRKSVSGLERRGLLRSTSLLGSPSRMFICFLLFLQKTIYKPSKIHETIMLTETTNYFCCFF